VDAFAGSSCMSAPPGCGWCSNLDICLPASPITPWVSNRTYGSCTWPSWKNSPAECQPSPSPVWLPSPSSSPAPPSDVGRCWSQTGGDWYDSSAGSLSQLYTSGAMVGPSGAVWIPKLEGSSATPQPLPLPCPACQGCVKGALAYSAAPSQPAPLGIGAVVGIALAAVAVVAAVAGGAVVWWRASSRLRWSPLRDDLQAAGTVAQSRAEVASGGVELTAMAAGTSGADAAMGSRDEAVADRPLHITGGSEGGGEADRPLSVSGSRQ